MGTASVKYLLITLADGTQIEVTAQLLDSRDIRPQDGDTLLCGSRDEPEMLFEVSKASDYFVEGQALEGPARLYCRVDLMGIDGPYYVDHLDEDAPEMFYDLAYVLSDRSGDLGDEPS